MKFKSPFKSAVVVAALGAVLFLTGSASAATAELFAATNSSPNGLAIDGSGNVFASLNNRDVAKIASNGTANLSWKSGLSDSPYQLSIGPSNSLVVQKGYSTIERFDSTGEPLYSYTTPPGLYSVVTDSTGNIWWITGSAVGRIPVNTASGSAPSGVSLSGASCLAVDAAGNAYVGAANKVVKFDSSGTRVSPDITVTGVDSGCAMSTDGTYGYVTTDGEETGGVARFPLAGGSAEATWVTSISPAPKYLAVGADGNIYTANRAMGMPGSSSSVSKITPTGGISTLATLSFTPYGMALDSQSNVYLISNDFFSAGVFKITQGAPAPSPTPVSPTTVKVGSVTSLAKLLSMFSVSTAGGAKASVDTSTPKVCKKTTAGVKAVATGACRGTITVRPKKGKATTKKFTLKVTKTGKRVPLSLHHR